MKNYFAAIIFMILLLGCIEAPQKEMLQEREPIEIGPEVTQFIAENKEILSSFEENNLLVKVEASLMKYEFTKDPALEGIDYLAWTPELEALNTRFGLEKVEYAYREYVNTEGNAITITPSWKKNEEILNKNNTGEYIKNKVDYGLERWVVFKFTDLTQEELLQAMFDYSKAEGIETAQPNVYYTTQ